MELKAFFMHAYRVRPIDSYALIRSYGLINSLVTIRVINEPLRKNTSFVYWPVKLLPNLRTSLYPGRDVNG